MSSSESTWFFAQPRLSIVEGHGGRGSIAGQHLQAVAAGLRRRAPADRARHHLPRAAQLHVLAGRRSGAGRRRWRSTGGPPASRPGRRSRPCGRSARRGSPRRPGSAAAVAAEGDGQAERRRGLGGLQVQGSAERRRPSGRQGKGLGGRALRPRRRRPGSLRRRAGRRATPGPAARRPGDGSAGGAGLRAGCAAHARLPAPAGLGGQASADLGSRKMPRLARRLAPVTSRSLSWTRMSLACRRPGPAGGSGRRSGPRCRRGS